MRLPGGDGLSRLWVLAGVLVTSAVIIGSSSAATYSTSCPSPPGDPDPGSIVDDAIETRHERQELAATCAALAERQEAVIDRLDALDEDGTTAQRVSLSPVDRQRLDLLWWGVWAGVGISLCLLFASKWHSAWRFLRE